jgi:hypothetical protein
MRRIRAKVERAKLAEHRFRDVRTALHLTLAAADLLRTTPGIANMYPRTSAALAHRLRRLERRAGALAPSDPR